MIAGGGQGPRRIVRNRLPDFGFSHATVDRVYRRRPNGQRFGCRLCQSGAGRAGADCRGRSGGCCRQGILGSRARRRGCWPTMPAWDSRRTSSFWQPSPSRSRARWPTCESDLRKTRDLDCRRRATGQAGRTLAGARLVRVMPNTPCLVGESASGYCLRPGSHGEPTCNA